MVRTSHMNKLRNASIFAFCSLGPQTTTTTVFGPTTTVTFINIYRCLFFCCCNHWTNSLKLTMLQAPGRSQHKADHSTRPITAQGRSQHWLPDSCTRPMTTLTGCCNQSPFLSQITMGMLKTFVTLHGRSVCPVRLWFICLRFSASTTSAHRSRNFFFH